MRRGVRGVSTFISKNNFLNFALTLQFPLKGVSGMKEYIGILYKNIYGRSISKKKKIRIVFQTDIFLGVF